MASEHELELSRDPILKSLTVDQAGRSVVVSNFPLQTTAETVAIYLLKKGLGGEIDHVHIPEKGTAVVTFETKEAMVKTLHHPPVPKGSSIVVQPLIPKELKEPCKEAAKEGNRRKVVNQGKETRPNAEIESPGSDQGLAATHTGFVKPDNRPTMVKQDPKPLEQHSEANLNWRQVESDLMRMREALNEEKQRRSIKKQELREMEKALISNLQNIINKEQQARAMVEAELINNKRILEEVRKMLVEEQSKKTLVNAQLNEANIACSKLEERLYDKESIIGELEKTLEEEEKAKNAVNEELSTVRTSWKQQEETLRSVRRKLNDELSLRERIGEELRNKEIISDNLQKSLEEEQKTRIAMDRELAQIQQTIVERDKTIEELQRALEEEQHARTDAELVSGRVRSHCDDLEQRLEGEELKSQSRQRDVQTKQNLIGELRLRLEEDNRLKTRLQDSVRSLELRMDEERDRYISIIRQLRSDAVAAREAVTESRDWIIQREEVVLGENILGRGAWGHVREGTFRGCQVAVKEIHSLILSDHNRRLFEREMSIASRCRHPNLLQFIGAASDRDSSPLFVTELLDTSLRNLMSERRLSQDEIFIIALDIAKALNYLHLSKPIPIMHRDISSANVLLWKREGSWRAKLSDYGAANFMRQQMTANPGAMIYSAPEALTSQQSPKVDVYSFGVLMCEMCIGELPDPQRLHNQISRVAVISRGLIRRCVQRNPDARPPVSDVIRELEEIRKPTSRRNLLRGLLKW